MTHKITHRILPSLLILVMACGLDSCKNYLDIKPDAKLVVPATLADCQALLDNYINMNSVYPSSEGFADNYYLTFADYNARATNDQDNYVWKATADMAGAVWHNPYQAVLYANQAIATLDQIGPGQDQADWNRIKGEALVFRAFNFYMVAQLWAQPFNAATAGTDLGIPLHLTPDISEKTTRASVQQTYNQIIQDLQSATSLLPADQPVSIITKTRPGKAAALALLARTYLAMGDYANAGLFADACLQNYGVLINYNTLSATASFPLVHFNAEVIFDTYTFSVLTLNPSIAKVDPNLYASYAANDLRHSVFFKANTGANLGTYQFKGGYNGATSLFQFCGPTTDEMYLVRAECAARAGNATAAMGDLNTLLQNRWLTGTYAIRTATSADDALSQVLVERRKELIFRSLRWTDLRRLNSDPRFAATLTRSLNGVTYTLPPNDLRYTLLIPQSVLQLEPMPQTPRP